MLLRTTSIAIARKEFPDGQTYITQTCLTYLSFEVFQSGYCNNDKDMETRLTTNPLLQYAARNWANHARGGVENILQVQILRVLSQESVLFATIQAMQLLSYRYTGYSQWPPKIVSGLWVAAVLNLTDIAMVLISRGIHLNIQTGGKSWSVGETVLLGALTRSHFHLAELLAMAALI
jgi:hypothetical protein